MILIISNEVTRKLQWNYRVDQSGKRVFDMFCGFLVNSLEPPFPRRPWRGLYISLCSSSLGIASNKQRIQVRDKYLSLSSKLCFPEREMVGPLRPQFVLFGSSIVQFSCSNGGWGAILADLYSRKVLTSLNLINFLNLVFSFYIYWLGFMMINIYGFFKIN